MRSSRFVRRNRRKATITNPTAEAQRWYADEGNQWQSVALKAPVEEAQRGNQRQSEANQRQSDAIKSDQRQSEACGRGSEALARRDAFLRRAYCLSCHHGHLPSRFGAFGLSLCLSCRVVAHVAEPRARIFMYYELLACTCPLQSRSPTRQSCLTELPVEVGPQA